MKPLRVVSVDYSTGRVLLECFVNNPEVVGVGETLPQVALNLAARAEGRPLFYSGMSPEQIARYEQILDEHLAQFGVDL